MRCAYCALRPRPGLMQNVMAQWVINLPDVASPLQQSREIYVTLNTRREHVEAGAEDLFRPRRHV